VLTLPLSLMTNAITLDEKVFYQAGGYLMWGLLIWQFFNQVRTLHNFSTGRAIAVMVLTLIGMLIIWVLLGLVYALTSEVVRFIQQVALEIYVRQY